MPPTASHSSTTVRDSNRDARPTADGLGSPDEPDQTSDRDQRDLTGDRDERPPTRGRDEHTPWHDRAHAGERNEQSGGVEVTQSGSVQRTRE
jgi:hypothetical protein